MTAHDFAFIPQDPTRRRGSMSTRTTTNRVMLHCTADPEGRDRDYDYLWNLHVSVNGWSDIGYHWVVQLDGTILECRKEHLQGAGCSGQNHDTIHLSYVGGLAADGKTAKDTMTPEQEKAFVQILLDIASRYPHMNRDSIVGHNEYAAKDCPSFNVDEKILKFVELAGEVGNPEPGDPDVGAIGMVLKDHEKRITELEQMVVDLIRWKQDD